MTDRAETTQVATAPSSLARVIRFEFALAAIVIVAAFLRLWAIDFGLPWVTHPDEPFLVDAARGMVRDRTLNPHWFIYPAFIIDLGAVVVAIVRVSDWIFGLSEATIRTADYLGSRIVSASFGIAAVALTGLLGRRMALRRPVLVGIASAILLAVSQMHVEESHYFKSDIATSFFTALTLWFTLDALEHDRRRSWLLAGMAVGLATAAKYNGVLVAVIPAAAFFMSSGHPRKWLRRWRIPVLMTLVSIGVFLAFNPFVVLSPSEFMSAEDGLAFNWEHYAGGHHGFEGSDTWLWYLQEIGRSGFGPTLAPFVFAGLIAEIGFLWRRDRRWFLLLLFPVVYYLFVSQYVVRFNRILIPILPFLAIIGARWLGFVPFPSRSRLARVALVVVALGLLVYPVSQSVIWALEKSKTDTRYPAFEWLDANAAPGSIIAREWHTPEITQAGYDYEDLYIRSAFDYPRQWYQDQSVDYLIVSSLLYDRYLDDPDQYPEQAAFYQQLLPAPSAAKFSADETHAGPTIIIYSVDEILPLLPDP